MFNLLCELDLCLLAYCFTSLILMQSSAAMRRQTTASRQRAVHVGCGCSRRSRRVLINQRLLPPLIPDCHCPSVLLPLSQSDEMQCETKFTTRKQARHSRREVAGICARTESQSESIPKGVRSETSLTFPKKTSFIKNEDNGSAGLG